MNQSHVIGPGNLTSIAVCGDIKFDKYGQQYIYTGYKWQPITAPASNNPVHAKMRFKQAMEEYFEKYPGLKGAWDQYEMEHNLVIGEDFEEP